MSGPGMRWGARTERLDAGASIPGFTPRLLSIAVVVAAAAAVGVHEVWLAVLATLAVVGAVLPLIGGTWFAAGALVVLLVVQPPHPGHTAVIVAAVHLLHVLATLSLVVPLRARIAVRALAPTGIRFAIGQAAGQAAALVAVWLPRSDALPWAVLVAAAATLVLGVVATRLLRGRRHVAFPMTGSTTSDPIEAGITP